MTVHFLRQHWAGEGSVVTESNMLIDSRLGIEREVDITVEASIDGEPILISFEVIEHGRRATITWVEQVIAKHEYLPTNRLVLVSKSGFSASAMAAVKSQGGWVAAVTPEQVEGADGPAYTELFLGTIQIRTTSGTLTLTSETDGAREVSPRTKILSPSGDDLGTALELTNEIVRLPWLGTHLLNMAYNAPNRNDLSQFTLGLDVASLGLRARIEPGYEYAIRGVELVGELKFEMHELTLEIAAMSGRRFASGTARILGQEAVLVGTDDEDGKHSTLSFRSVQDKPLTPEEPPRAEAFEPYLGQILPPSEWAAIHEKEELDS